jgi:plasmid maintenance system antidote protein VapI
MKSNPEILILRAALADVGISAASLARAAGLSPSLLQEILADRRRLTEEVQSRLALALDTYAQRAALAADAIRSIEADM